MWERKEGGEQLSLPGRPAWTQPAGTKDLLLPEKGACSNGKQGESFCISVSMEKTLFKKIIRCCCLTLRGIQRQRFSAHNLIFLG